MKIQISDKELKRIKPAKTYYADDSVNVEHLEVGDYIFDDQVVFEYKTFDDFCTSIIDNRIFNESVKQAERFQYHYVIIELGSYNLNIRAALTDRNYRAPVKIPPASMYGVFARLNSYTTVIVVNGGMRKCFNVMRLQAVKCLDDKLLIPRGRFKEVSPALNFLCNCVYGVNQVKAQSITRELGVTTLKDLLDMEYDDLIQVKGIGPKSAKKILKQLKG
jgi:ERCC4-type nuclease